MPPRDNMCGAPCRIDGKDSDVDGDSDGDDDLPNSKLFKQELTKCL